MTLAFTQDSLNTASENRLPLLPLPVDNAMMESNPFISATPKRKRRWFQFSLRSLMIPTVHCRFVCGRLGREIELGKIPTRTSGKSMCRI
jgi:hypothetical protein